MHDIIAEIAQLKTTPGRHDPRPLLPGWRDSGPGRLHRRQPQAGPRRHAGDDRDHRLLRRAFHGRDGQDPQPRASACCCPTCWPAAAWPRAARADKLARYQEMLRDNGRRFQTVTYINSTAAVKALSDWVVTSGNAEDDHPPRAGGQEILFVPDRHLGQYLAGGHGPQDDPVERSLHGPRDLQRRRSAGHETSCRMRITVAHPECPANIREHSDFVGGTEAHAQATSAASRSRPISSSPPRRT